MNRTTSGAPGKASGVTPPVRILALTPCARRTPRRAAPDRRRSAPRRTTQSRRAARRDALEASTDDTRASRPSTIAGTACAALNRAGARHVAVHVLPDAAPSIAIGARRSADRAQRGADSSSRATGTTNRPSIHASSLRDTRRSFGPPPPCPARPAGTARVVDDPGEQRPKRRHRRDLFLVFTIVPRQFGAPHRHA